MQQHASVISLQQASLAMALHSVIWDEMVGGLAANNMSSACPAASQGQQLTSVRGQLVWGFSKQLLPGQSLNQVTELDSSL